MVARLDEDHALWYPYIVSKIRLLQLFEQKEMPNAWLDLQISNPNMHTMLLPKPVTHEDLALHNNNIMIVYMLG